MASQCVHGTDFVYEIRIRFPIRIRIGFRLDEFRIDEISYRRIDEINSYTNFVYELDEIDEIRIRISSPGDEIRIRIGEFVYELGIRIRISSPPGDEIRPPVKFRRGGHVLSLSWGKIAVKIMLLQFMFCP